MTSYQDRPNNDYHKNDSDFHIDITDILRKFNKPSKHLIKSHR